MWLKKYIKTTVYIYTYRKQMKIKYIKLIYIENSTYKTIVLKHNHTLRNNGSLIGLLCGCANWQTVSKMESTSEMRFLLK